MDAPTIAQAKAAAPENLWHFLVSLPQTMEAQIWCALMLGGLVGMVGHYIRGRASGNIAGNPMDYFFRDNLWRSVMAVLAVAAELFGEIGTGIFTTSNGEFVGWGIVLLSGLKSGYGLDSLVNKATRPEWTPAKRVAQEIAKTEIDIPPPQQKGP